VKSPTKMANIANISQTFPWHLFREMETIQRTLRKRHTMFTRETRNIKTKVTLLQLAHFNNQMENSTCSNQHYRIMKEGVENDILALQWKIASYHKNRLTIRLKYQKIQEILSNIYHTIIQY
jgi:hypothetical protein